MSEKELAQQIFLVLLSRSDERYISASSKQLREEAFEEARAFFEDLYIRCR